jgi:hypothetical protein
MVFAKGVGVGASGFEIHMDSAHNSRVCLSATFADLKKEPLLLCSETHKRAVCPLKPTLGLGSQGGLALTWSSLGALGAAIYLCRRGAELWFCTFSFFLGDLFVILKVGYVSLKRLGKRRKNK